MNDNNAKVLFPIREVSLKTGVNSVTLRAWERRYGLIKPQRTAKGHRLYSNNDIELIRAVVKKLEQGLSISKVSQQILFSSESNEEDSSQGPWLVYRQRFIDSIAEFDEAVLNAAYNEAMSLYPIEVVTQKLIEPLLQKLGQRWEKAGQSSGNTPVAEEHFFSVFIRNKLGARFHHRNIRNQGPKLVLACLPGELHEFGLLLFALAAHERGFRIVILGADMPVNELPLVIQKTRADALILSGSETLFCENLQNDLVKIMSNTSIPMYIGGDISIICKHSLKAQEIGLIGIDIGRGLNVISQRFNL